MGNYCMKSAYDNEESLEFDPQANFPSAMESRYIVRAIHPATGERLRAELLARSVPWPDTDDPDDDGRPKPLKGHFIRWGSYWVKESGSDCIVESYEVVDDLDIPSARFNFYLSWVQTVGSPGFTYEKGEEVFCKDSAGQWHLAIISGVEAMYYFVRYSDDTIPAQWIHKFSPRLHKVEKFEGLSANTELWDTLYELDWIKVRHPTNGQYMPAKIVLKDNSESGNERIVVKFEDSSLLVQQEQIFRSELQEDSTKIFEFEDWKERWRFNRLFVFQKALKSVGLRLVAMNGENGHSLYRALSHQLFGTANNWQFLRFKTLEHISKHKEYFGHFVDINFEYYIAHKRKGAEGEYFSLGDHLDVQAVCELYDARAEIYSELSPRPLDTIRFYQQFENLPLIRLSYRGQGHYDSVEDIRNPVPLTVERDLHRVPLGNQMAEERGVCMVLDAREAELKRVMDLDSSLSKSVHLEQIVCTWQGLCSFGNVNDTYDRLDQLFHEIGLRVSLPKRNVKEDEGTKPVDAAKEKKFTSDSNPDIVVWYPGPMEDPTTPTIKIQGLEPLVMKAVRFVRANAKVSNLRETQAGSRVGEIDRMLKAQQQQKREREKAKQLEERQKRRSMQPITGV